MVEEQPEAASAPATTSAGDNEMELIAAPGPTGQDEAPPMVPSSLAEDARTDIWMAPLSNEPTPQAIRTTTSISVASPVPEVQHSPSAVLESVASEADGFAEGAPSVSDAPSAVDAPTVNMTRSNDTVAQEDFSMIFMDSIQSFQDFKSSIPAPDLTRNDFGEETSRIINDTLEFLRQSSGVGKEAQRLEELPEEAAGADDEGQEHEEMPEAEPELAQQSVAEAEPEEERDIEQEEPNDQGIVDFEGDDIGEPEEGPEMQEEPGPVRTKDHIGEVVEAYAMDRRENETTEPVELASSPPPQGEPDELASEETTPVKNLTALSPGRMFSSRLSRSPRKSNISPLRRRVLDSTTKHADATPRGSERDTTGRRSSDRFNEDESNIYEDSFSEIPQEILEAATPRRPAAAPVIELEDNDEMEQVEYAEEPQQGEEQPTEEAPSQPHQFSYHTNSSLAQQAPPSNASSIAQTDGGRLPTPDDTPPNIEAETGESPEKSEQSLQPSSPVEPHAQLTSEHDAAPASPRAPPLLEPPYPPRASMERGSPVVEVTPLNQMSSPAQEPQSAVAEPTPDKAPRPALSAIVRAGRVLQSVTSDPPSPGDRQNQLGSPFRSSASKESWSGSREPQSGRRATVSASPNRRSLGHQRQSASVDQLNDDPFGSTSRATGQSSFMQALGRSVHESASKPQESTGGSAASSMRITPPDDEMSWVANEGRISPNLRGDNLLREAAGLSTTGAEKGFVSRTHTGEPTTEDRAEGAPQTRDAEANIWEVEAQQPEPEPTSEDGAEEAPQPKEDETDIWEVEAQRSEPESTSKQYSFISGVSAPLHRRSALPSPWTTSTSMAAGNRSFRNAPGSSSMADRTTREYVGGETEEYSLLEQRQKAQEAEATKASGSAAKENRFDLSSFFSSPAAIPGKLAEKFFPSKPSTSGIEASSVMPVVPTNSMFPSVPQKSFEPGEDSRPDLFSSPEQPQEPQKEDRIDHGSASPDTPERLEMPLSAQKKNFTPRPRQTNESFFVGSAAHSGAPTPPRMQLSHADIQRWQQETSNASEDSEEAPRRFLRPLPPRNASPTKSSLRSPLKPHTPGRVVEFTSSVLSPVEQARQRQQRRMSDIAAAETEPIPQPESIEPFPAMDDKENRDSDVSMSDASPLTKPALRPETLSQTAWTRQHWLFMDKLLQHRRKTPFGIQVERRSSKYLGKKVRSQGESMVLEQWQLDCVDAFKAVVGGWDEGVLAKRLFALIMGEEKRQRRSIERATTTVMFH